jgi:F-type H+-transporting ATPase subunit gamma
MPTLEGLRRQIDTATDLSSVVTTMKTLAAVSIHQYERAVEALAEYNRTIELGFQIALTGEPLRLDADQPPGKTAAVVFGSDQGMCGQFNEAIVSFLNTNSEEDDARRSWTLLAIGVRAEGQLLDAGWNDRAHLRRTHIRFRHYEPGAGDAAAHRASAQRSGYLAAAGVLQPANVCVILRAAAASVAADRFPATRALARRAVAVALAADVRYRAAALLSRLIQQYLFVSLFRACAESLASENASRIAAMQAAEKNIEERLDELHGSFNQLRQSAITEELLDVVHGLRSSFQRASGVELGGE